MDNQTAIAFVEKAISKTKSNNLSWSTLSPDFYMKPLPSEAVDFTDYTRVTISPPAFILGESYYTKYKTGIILLLVYHVQLSVSVNPYDLAFSLRIQDDKSRYSSEIADSAYSSDLDIALHRLYNLIDKSNSSLKILINDFLNS